MSKAMDGLRKVKFAILTLLFYCTVISCYDYQASLNASRELHAILESGKYNPDDIPYSITNGSVNVKVQLSILALGPIDSKAFTFRIDYFLRMWWVDERLKFSKGKVTLTGNPKGKIWIPDLYVMNSREVKQHSLGETFRTVVKSDGEVFWSTRVNEICSCPMNLRNFPIDEQKCQLIFESYAYNSQQLTLNWKEIPIEVDRGHLKVNDFEVKAFTTSKEDVKYIVGDKFEHLEVTTRVRRTLTNYIARIYVPSMALVVMTWGTFWLPKSTYPARVAIIVTNFLASIVLLRDANSHTKVPYTTAMDIFFIMNVVFIVASVIEYMITLHHRHFRTLLLRKGKLRHEDSIGMSQIKKGEEDPEKKPLSKPKSKKEPTPFSDKISRYIFPFLYFLFLVIYFPYYTSKYED